MIKNISSISTIALLAFMSASSAGWAADCAKEARKLASQSNAEVLSVSDLGGGKCAATLRIPGKNGKAPRVVNRTFNG